MNIGSFMKISRGLMNKLSIIETKNNNNNNKIKTQILSLT